MGELIDLASPRTHHRRRATAVSLHSNLQAGDSATLMVRFPTCDTSEPETQRQAHAMKHHAFLGLGPRRRAARLACGVTLVSRCGFGYVSTDSRIE